MEALIIIKVCCYAFNVLPFVWGGAGESSVSLIGSTDRWLSSTESVGHKPFAHSFTANICCQPVCARRPSV